MLNIFCGNDTVLNIYFFTLYKSLLLLLINLMTNITDRKFWNGSVADIFRVAIMCWT